MGYDGLVNIEEELAREPNYPELIARRLPHVNRLIQDFTEYYEDKFGVSLTVNKDIAEFLTGLYFKVCYEKIKPLIPARTNKYKMASLMELLIVKLQVFATPDGSILENREINAKFAMAAGLSMINSLISDAKKEYYFQTMNAGVDEMVSKVIDDHTLWLTTKDVNEMPIFITAQFHELIEILCRAPYQIHG